MQIIANLHKKDVIKIIQRIIKYFKDERLIQYDEIKQKLGSQYPYIYFIENNESYLCILCGHPADLNRSFIFKSEKKNNIMWISYNFKHILRENDAKNKKFILYQML